MVSFKLFSSINFADRKVDKAPTNVGKFEGVSLIDKRNKTV